MNLSIIKIEEKDKLNLHCRKNNVQLNYTYTKKYAKNRIFFPVQKK